MSLLLLMGLVLSRGGQYLVFFESWCVGFEGIHHVKDSSKEGENETYKAVRDWLGGFGVVPVSI